MKKKLVRSMLEGAPATHRIVSIEFPLPIPSKKNSKRAFVSKSTHKLLVLPSEAHEKWHRDAMLIIMGAKNHYRVPKNECFYHCAVSVQFTDDTKYSYDYTNKLESIMDALVDAGMILDDNRFVVHNISATTNQVSAQRGALVLIDGFSSEYLETLSIPKGGEKMKSVQKPVKAPAPKKGVVVKGAAMKKAPKGKC